MMFHRWHTVKQTTITPGQRGIPLRGRPAARLDGPLGRIPLRL